MKKTLSYMMSGCAVLLVSAAAQAAVLTEYTFDSATGSPGGDTPVNWSRSDFSFGPGLPTTGSNPNGFSSGTESAFVRANHTDTTEADAVLNGDYMEFSITADSGFAFSLESIAFTYTVEASNGFYIGNLSVRSSIDSFASAIPGTTTSQTTDGARVDGPAVDADLTALAGYNNAAGTVTFRIYAWDTGTGSTTDNSGSIIRVDNVTVEGSIVPEPALLGLGGLMIVGRRRRARVS